MKKIVPMKQVIKKRDLRIATLTSFDQQRIIREGLSKIHGMRKVEVDAGGQVHVEYDLLKVRLEQIEEVLESWGFGLRSGLLGKIKRALIHDTEQNEFDNLTAQNSPCCSNPKLS